MISGLAGDQIGSVFESNNSASFKALFSKKSTYTDDSVLTVATCDVILNGGSYSDAYLSYAKAYPNRGYGASFSQWVNRGGGAPYNSYGNGSAMRVSPVGFAFNTYEDILCEAEKSASSTHNSPEGIKGAQAIAVAIWMARNKKTKEEIKDALSKVPFEYDLTIKMDDFSKKFDVTCQGTIPRCWAIFNEAHDFESAMRLSISMGGDVDTNCCIVGGLIEAYYGYPSNDIVQAVYERLPSELSDITTKFVRKFINPSFEPPLFEPRQVFMNSILDLEIEDDA